MEVLTEFEQAAIVYHVFNGCNDRAILFQIAEGTKRYNDLTDKSKGVTVSRWFNTHKIQEGIKAFKAIQEEQKQRILIEYQRSQETEATKREGEQPDNGDVNFLDRDEFLSFLNTRANEITDDKLRNDILKMLSDNLRYKDTERDENNEIQRFYTPVICESCPIYQKCSGCSLSSCPKI